MKNNFPKEKLVDYGKNLLICALFLCAVFLMSKAVFFEQDSALSNFGKESGSISGNGSAGSSEGNLFTSAAEPMYILITMKDNSHYSAKYDSANKTKLFSQFSSSLGEALGSSGDAVQITEEEWQTALGDSGVFFDYLYPQPLSSIALWLGTKMDYSGADYTARRLYLGGGTDGALYLYFINEADYSFYRCKTALSFSTLSSGIAELPIGNSHFAFEKGEEYANLDPYFIFSDESNRLRAVDVANPLKDGNADMALLELFLMNSRTTSELPEADGSKTYVDDKKTLRVDVAGKVSFSITGPDGLEIHTNGDNLRIDDCINAANSIVQSSIGVLSGDASVGLTSFAGGKNPGTYTLTFNYNLDGIPVDLPGDTCAARVQISNGSIVRIDLLFRQYAYTGGYFTPMPEKVAAAIAKDGGGEPVLRYDDSTSSVSCSWITN